MVKYGKIIDKLEKEQSKLKTDLKKLKRGFDEYSASHPKNVWCKV